MLDILSKYCIIRCHISDSIYNHAHNQNSSISISKTLHFQDFPHLIILGTSSTVDTTPPYDPGDLHVKTFIVMF